ncbi:MAG: class I SAM-dependent methyltransferase [Oscillospiraceae bacterium]|jgi:2-polyprenyl-3-methyl-5-hydroxy-6-metoxy-1,4-benzoquinol methylase|nr:class I SAM-dependent methyltransferase [Oscillospiraceae bacterium]
MKNIDNWVETKYIIKKGQLRGTKNKNYLAISSRLIADLVAINYDCALKNYAKGNLIDLGCGNVPFYVLYSRIGVSVTCADWEHKNEHLDIVCDFNCIPLPIESNSYDTVVLSDVLEHIKFPDKFFNEISRIMKKGGYLILNTPFFYMIHEAPDDYYRYTKYAFNIFAKQAELDIVQISPYGGVIECISDLNCKLAVKIPFVGRFLSEFIRILCVGIGKTSIGMKIQSKSSKSITLGYFVIMRK